MPADAVVKEAKKPKSLNSRAPKTKGKNSRGWVGVCPSLTGSHMGPMSRAFLKLNFCHQIRGWPQICTAAAVQKSRGNQSQNQN